MSRTSPGRPAPGPDAAGAGAPGSGAVGPGALLDALRAVQARLDADGAPAPAATPRPRVSEDARGRSLQFGDDVVQSRHDPQEPARLLLPYTRRMAGALLWHPAPRTVLMIGLGGGSLVRFLREVSPASVLAVAEINPQVVALRGPFDLPPDDGRWAVLTVDGARLLQGWAAAGAPPAALRPQVLLVDGFDADGLAAPLTTAAFFTAAAGVLARDGWLVMNLWAPAAQRRQVRQRVAAAFAGRTVFTVDDAVDEDQQVLYAGGPPHGAAHPRPVHEALARLGPGPARDCPRLHESWHEVYAAWAAQA